MRCYALRDAQWDKIKTLLAESSDYVGVTAKVLQKRFYIAIGQAFHGEIFLNVLEISE